MILSFDFTLKSQDFVNSLFGIRLGQYKDCVGNHFGKAFQVNKFEDGWTYQAFIVTKDSTLYLVTESTKEQPDLIQTIQLTGKRSDLPVLKGLKIGDSKSAVFKILGKPIDSVKIDENNVKAVRFSFKKANYSVEIAKDKLYSVKIEDNSYELFKNKKPNIPDFNELLGLFAKNDKTLLLDLFCSDIEVSKGGDFYTLKYPYSDELIGDKSGVFKILLDSQFGLSTLKNDNLIDQNLRIMEKQPLMYVFKFKNHLIQEIVFKDYQGLYKIWEIKYKN